MIGDILLCEGTKRKRLPGGSTRRVHRQGALATGTPGVKIRGSEVKDLVRRNIGAVLTATAVIILLLVAFILALAQDKLPELALDLLVYLFAITLGVFVIERMLAWREERRWLAAKNWLYMILLETIDDLLKELLPERRGEMDGEIPVYEVIGEAIHFGEAVAYSPLQLLVGPDDRDLQSHIHWYVEKQGPPRYADLARAALSDAREQVRDMLASSGQLMEAEITAMVMSFDQAVAAAIRHLDSAVSMRDEKIGDITYLDNEGSAEQRIGEADNQLAFVTSIIVESVVSSAVKPKAWLEDEMYSREGQSPFRSLPIRS
jgi:hypothetical protein